MVAAERPAQAKYVYDPQSGRCLNPNTNSTGFNLVKDIRFDPITEFPNTFPEVMFPPWMKTVRGTKILQAECIDFTSRDPVNLPKLLGVENEPKYIVVKANLRGSKLGNFGLIGIISADIAGANLTHLNVVYFSMLAKGDEHTVHNDGTGEAVTGAERFCRRPPPLIANNFRSSHGFFCDFSQE